MSQQIRITVGDSSYAAELNDSPTAKAIYDALPIKGSGSRWGEEIYFAIGVDEKLAPGARDEVEVGGLAYWPPGKAFCIFFGPTPASVGDEPRAASEVNHVGRIVDDVSSLTSAPNGVQVVIEPV